MKEISKAAYHLMHCTDNIGYARTYLHEMDNSGVCSPDIRDRIDELDAILSDLQEVQDYLENTDFPS